MQPLDFYTTPARPVGPINPAELPVADAVLEAACFDLLPTERRPVLYRRLTDRFTHLAEELYHRLFDETPPAPAQECRVIPFRQTA
ncbi:hypothetical protein [Hymenobacter mucosus]|uniref:Uncharacterized protein n=1 Tax=Hymenobacter mucosus TaxID=1411120 RepID=A0A239A7S6_9BACT|nr:hypothetical protein [Hymenobacter mucosus]SNR91559.1 hypothetical protein SAMN06269173_11139 [Hymenobacter mucosus]